MEDNGHQPKAFPEQSVSVSTVALSLDHQTGMFRMSMGGPMNEMILLYLLDLANTERLKQRAVAQSRIVQPYLSLGGHPPKTSQ